MPPASGDAVRGSILRGCVLATRLFRAVRMPPRSVMEMTLLLLLRQPVRVCVVHMKGSRIAPLLVLLMMERWRDLQARMVPERIVLEVRLRRVVEVVEVLEVLEIWVRRVLEAVEDR